MMTGIEYYKFLGITEDLWTYIKRVSRPVVIYGMGNGADKTIDILEKNQIYISDIFASDEFVRGQTFHGKTVIKFSDAVKKYNNDMIVLTAFGSHLDSVIEHIYKLSGECEMYAPDVPVCGNTMFDMQFFTENIERFSHSRELLCDEQSKLLFDNIIRYKLTGSLDFLKSASAPNDEKKILQTEKYTKIADLGAYNGDTIRYYSGIFPNIKSVIAVEPDLRTFKKLLQYSENESRFSIECHNKAVSDTTGVIEFSSSGNRGSNVSDSRKTTKFHSIEVDTLDNILREAFGNIDFIKYDVEGSEAEALKGSEKTITKYSPDIAVSMYHRTEDIFALAELISEMCPSHRLYLRRKMCIPAWEIMLYAVKKPF